MIRLGIVGAGQIARTRHIPGFRAIDGVQIHGVCNRRRDSSARVAHEFEIPQIFESWEHLVDSPEIDAVVIGTWPYLHAAITLAALEAGKHVLCQARMAMNAREAQRMLDKSRERPDLAAMVVPSPYGLAGDAFVRGLIDGGFLGDCLHEIHVTSFSDRLADPRTPLSWRQVTRYSGFNTLDLGILHETLLRWTAPPRQVFARASKFIPRRQDPDTAHDTRVGTADSVHVIATNDDESVAIYRHSAVHWHEPACNIILHGSGGTLAYDLLSDEIEGGQIGEPLRPLPIPPELRGGWNVEADFIAAIRDGQPVLHTSFETGVRYMQFTEAVARSSRHQEPVTLPLQEFSNPSL